MGRKPNNEVSSHLKLVRAAVQAIAELQQVMGSENDPLYACSTVMELLTTALHGQSLPDEQVIISVRGGVAEVEFKTPFVNVTIKDYDNAEAYRRVK